jgi:DNA-binding MarR family transcriptional regulator
MAQMARTRRAEVRTIDYRRLAELRYRIRQFLRGREIAARAIGVEPQQYLLLLQIKGLQRSGPATIGRLAERLQVRHHTTVGLVDRLARRGMVTRRRGRRDRRQVQVELRPAGEVVLRRLALQSLAELRTEGPALVAVLRQLTGQNRANPRPTRRARGRIS